MVKEADRDKIEDWEDSLAPYVKDIEKCKAKLLDDPFLSLVYVSGFLATSVQRYFDSTEIRKIANRKDFRVLHTLILHGGRAKPTQISKDILRSKFAVSRVIDSLEIRGLVKREPFGEDLRTREIVVTEKGIEVTISCTEYVLNSIIPKVLDNMSQEQKQNLRRVLKRINDYILNCLTRNEKDSSSINE